MERSDGNRAGGREKRLAANTFENMPGGFMIFRAGAGEEILAVNEKLLEIFECGSREEFRTLTGGTFPGMVLKEDVREAETAIWNQLRSGIDRLEFVSYRIRTKKGKVRSVESFGRLVTDPEEGELFYTFLTDIDVKYTTYDIDHLTGLPGQRRFLEYAERFSSINRMNPDARRYDYLYLNLMGFRNYNIRCGKAAGDEFLRNFAQILRTLFPNDVVARLGDDHFAGYPDEENARRKIGEVKKKVRRRVPDRPLPVKVGVCREILSESAQHCCDFARIACDSIRNRVGESVCFYNPQIHSHMLAQEYAAEHLDDAIEGGMIEVWYQPVVRPGVNRLASLEALARWRTPDGKMLSPGDFVPALEKSRQIDRLDACVIDEVCRNLREQADRGRPVIPVSFNLSRLDFFLTDIFQVVEQAVERWHVDRSSLFVEVTESVLTEDAALVMRVMDRFRAAGYRIWIDDFGSGYSSLNVLKDYRFDVLKIDMEFLSSFSPTAQTIIRSVVAMSREIGIEPLAEGAETDEQVHFLEEAGCPLVQGFLYSRPLPYEECMELCRRKNLMPESMSERLRFRQEHGFDTAQGAQ